MLFTNGCILLISLGCLLTLTKANDNVRQKRTVDLTEAMLSASIRSGTSLSGTTVGDLKQSSYRVAVSGSVENYSKWALLYKGCEIAAGQMNLPLRSVAAGQREGFASHKTAHAAKGSFVKCTLLVGDKLVHFMYSAPYSFDFHANYLAVGICHKDMQSDTRGYPCRDLTAKIMYYYTPSFVSIRQFYRNIHTVKYCDKDLCISGVMGTSHQPEINLKVMPQKYEDLYNEVKDDSVKDHWGKDEYEKFVNS